MAPERFENGFETGKNRIAYVLLTTEMEIPSFPQRTGLGPARKSKRQMGLRNGIFLGKGIPFSNDLDFVERVMVQQQVASNCESLLKIAS